MVKYKPSFSCDRCGCLVERAQVHKITTFFRKPSGKQRDVKTVNFMLCQTHFEEVMKDCESLDWTKRVRTWNKYEDQTA